MCFSNLKLVFYDIHLDLYMILFPFSRTTFFPNQAVNAIAQHEYEYNLIYLYFVNGFSQKVRQVHYNIQREVDMKLSMSIRTNFCK